MAAMGARSATGAYQGRPVAWGLGWDLGGPGDLRSHSALFHYGGSGTGFWVDRELGLTVAFLTTSWLLDWSVYAQVGNALYGALSAG
jgi:CubicO group peptidase (beta-lactamase class C family)